MAYAGSFRPIRGGALRRLLILSCGLMIVEATCASALEYSPFNLAGFETNASLGLGAIFRDNLLFQPIQRTPALGSEISPTISATRSGSIGTTSVFGSIDAGIFPGHSLGDYSQYLASISHVYSPRKDLTFTGGLSFNHQDGNANNNGVQTSVNLANYSVTSFSANGSVEKDFGRIINITSGSFSDTTVPNSNSAVIGLGPLTTISPTTNIASTTPSLFGSLPQGSTQTISLSNQTTYSQRPLLTPSLTETFQKSFGAYNQILFGGEAGLAIGRIGLFTSNVSAGAQLQSSSNPSAGNVRSTSNTSTYDVGFATTYDFRRYLVFTFSARVAYGALALPTVGAAFAQNNGQTVGGAPQSGGVAAAGATEVINSNNTLQKSFTAAAIYTLFARATINASLSYNALDQGTQPTTIFTAQTGLSYSLTAANDLNFSYQYTRATGLQALSSSLVTSAALQQLPIEVNTVRLGVRHRF